MLTHAHCRVGQVLLLRAGGWARDGCHSSRALATSPPQWIGFFLGSPLGEVSGIQGQLLLYAVIKWHLKVRLSSDQPEMPATWRKGPS